MFDLNVLNVVKICFCCSQEYPSIEAQGAYKYIAPGGEPVSVTYVANENGFQPEVSEAIEIN